jgi:hypothetical protein
MHEIGSGIGRAEENPVPREMESQASDEGALAFQMPSLASSIEELSRLLAGIDTSSAGSFALIIPGPGFGPTPVTLDYSLLPIQTLGYERAQQEQ